MNTEIEQISVSLKRRMPETISRVGIFIWHFIEMCMVMCVGGITLNVIFFMGAAKVGYPDLFERYPVFSLIVVGTLLAVPMTAWMRFRGHEWRPTLEMASTSIILPILLIGAAWLGIIPDSSRLEWLKRLVCPVMLIPMLFRLDLYTVHHANHKPQAQVAHLADEHLHHSG